MQFYPFSLFFVTRPLCRSLFINDVPTQGRGKVCQNTDLVREVACILHSKSAPNGAGRGIKNFQNCTRGIIHACPLILFSALALLLTCFCLDVSGRGDDLRRAGELVGGEGAERPPGEPPRRGALGLRARRRVRHVLKKSQMVWGYIDLAGPISGRNLIQGDHSGR